MKIEKSEVTKIRISEVEHLDIINVVLDDIAPRQGRITIECYGKAWSSYWGGMGNRTIASFFCSCDNSYLSKNLAPQTKSRIPEDDEDTCRKHARERIIFYRKEKDLSREDARELYDSIKYAYFPFSQSLLSDIYGGEWYFSLPEKTNHEWEYLCRIIDAVKEGLNEVI